MWKPGKFQRFSQCRLRCQGRRKIRHYGVPCADDVDLASHLPRRNMLHRAAWIGTDDAALRECHKDRSPMTPGELNCDRFHFFEGCPLPFRQSSQLGLIHF